MSVDYIAHEPEPTNFNDLPLNIMGNIVEASSKLSFFEKGAWPVLTHGLETTWRQALPTSMTSELESPENYWPYPEARIKHGVKEKWGLEIAHEQICFTGDYYDHGDGGDEWLEKQEAFQESDEIGPCYMVWLIYDIPDDLDLKVIDKLRSHDGSRGGKQPAPTKPNALISLYRRAREAAGIITNYPEAWVTYAESLLKSKNPKTVVDVYNNLFNNDDPVMKMQFRMDVISSGW